jgi:hypothetical protein
MPIPAANQDSWDILPLPANRIPLGFVTTYDGSEAERIRQGFIPQQVEDKWFAYCKDDWLYFHRSWTGAGIFGVRFDSHGVRVIDSWITADPQQPVGDDLDYNRKLLGCLIDTLLLGKTCKFPIPPDLPDELAGIYQHQIIGITPATIPPPNIDSEKTAPSIDGKKFGLANKVLAFGYFTYAAAIILFIIAWLVSITTRLSQMHAELPSASLVPMVALLVTAILFTTLNIAIGRRLLANDRTRFTWILVLASLLEIPIGTGLAFITLLWLWSLRDTK